MNIDERNARLEQQIHAYVNGKLDPRQKDAFWKQLLKYPHYLDYLKVECLLKEMADKESPNNPDSSNTERDEKGIVFSEWINLALIMIIILAF